MARKIQVVFDAHHPPTLADFWATALGYQIPPPPEGFESWDAWATEMGIPEANWDDARAIEDPDGVGPRIFIQKVPEGKTAKNRVHIDIRATGGPDTPLEERKAQADAEAERLVSAGAKILEPYQERDEYWVVMADPEGNEFCVT